MQFSEQMTVHSTIVKKRDFLFLQNNFKNFSLNIYEVATDAAVIKLAASYVVKQTLFIVNPS